MKNEANSAHFYELEGMDVSELAEHGEAGPEYAGPERRRHRVYITRNTEYHVRDRCCVAVRDRRTGELLHGHLALHRRVEGGLRFFDNGAIAPNPGEPRQGESIYFAGDGRELVTSPLEATGRPDREMVSGYPSARSASGPSDPTRHATRQPSKPSKQVLAGARTR
jgi:hypothetical protein